MKDETWQQAVARITEDETNRLASVDHVVDDGEDQPPMPSWRDAIRPAVVARVVVECSDLLPSADELLAALVSSEADRADKASRNRSGHDLENPPLFSVDIHSVIWDDAGGRRPTSLAAVVDLVANSKAGQSKAERLKKAADRRELVNDQRAAEMIEGEHSTFGAAVDAGDCPPIELDEEDDDDPDDDE